MNHFHHIVIFLSTLTLSLSACANKEEGTEANKTYSATVAASDKSMVQDEEMEEVVEKSMPSPIVAPKKKERIGHHGKGAAGGAPGAENSPVTLGGLSDEKDQNASEAPAPRAWFPETFLFSPLVITDEKGQGSISVRVPDRLTTWRILGLAHNRSGNQAGTVTTFEGTLPTYVDPIVPSFLRLGDTISIPVQLVNNTDKELTTTLITGSSNQDAKKTSKPIRIAKRSSVVHYVEVHATEVGTLRFTAAMGNEDTVIRDIPILPTGKAVSSTKSGTLADLRSFSFKGSESEDASNGIVDVSVFPGALALLRSELQASSQRSGLAADAFSLLLAGKAPSLLQALGDKADPEELRRLTITATQKIMKHARALSIDNATLIAQAALSHTENPVLTRLGKRAISTIESSQSPDGTCGGQNGWSLQRLLVATADCARAAKNSPNVAIRAQGAFERHSKENIDPYTAASILAANAANGAFATHLQTLILDAISQGESGAKVLIVPDGVVRANGTRPSTVEATAMAILALADLPNAPLADLGATLLAGYSPQSGWGDGRANLVCMEAAVALFADPLPEKIKVIVRHNGNIVSEGLLDKEKVREVLHLHADDIDVKGSHTWEIESVPAVPGLGFSLTQTNWVPWKEEPVLGTELQITASKDMIVGKTALLSMQAIAPSGVRFTIQMPLPAGVQVDANSLQAMVQSGALHHFDSSDGMLTLHVAPLQPAKRFTAEIRLIPTLAGTLKSGVTTIVVGRDEGHLPGKTFVVKASR